MSVTLDDVGHRFPDGPVLFAGLSLVLEPGHTYAVVGPSGSGKSTLLAIIAGSVRPREGAVHRVGNDRIGWVHQNPLGSPRRTAMDHVVLALLLRGLTRSRAVAPARELLIDFGLVDIADQQLRTLSGGQAQRLMLAQGLASSPGVLLVDEPTAQLDIVTAGTVNESLRAAAGRGTAVVVATHDQRTRACCTDVIDLSTYLPGDSADVR